MKRSFFVLLLVSLFLCNINAQNCLPIGIDSLGSNDLVVNDELHSAAQTFRVPNTITNFKIETYLNACPDDGIASPVLSITNVDVGGEPILNEIIASDTLASDTIISNLCEHGNPFGKVVFSFTNVSLSSDTDYCLHFKAIDGAYDVNRRAGNPYIDGMNFLVYGDEVSSSASADLPFMIIPFLTGVDTQLAYGSYTWIDDVTYTESTSEPTFVIVTSNGCDSIITLNLTIEQCDVNTGISLNGNTLTADAINDELAEFQWLDCNDDMSIINGETTGTFTASDGSFAVEVSQDGCKDTSDCILVSGIRNVDYDICSSVFVYPNPVDREVFTLNLQRPYESLNLVLYSISGEILFEKTYYGESIIKIPVYDYNGIFILETTIDDETGHYVKLFIQ